MILARSMSQRDTFGAGMTRLFFVLSVFKGCNDSLQEHEGMAQEKRHPHNVAVGRVFLSGS